MEILNKIWDYLKWKRSAKGTSLFIRTMHGINKISILVFLIGLIFLFIRYFG